MKEELITFDTAKLAKEKGFGAETISYYHPHYGLCNEIGEKPEYYNNDSWADGYYSAPNQSLLQRWLREVHGIETTVYKESKLDYSVSVGLNCSMENPLQNCEHQYKTYEQALEAGLLEALKMIKL